MANIYVKEPPTAGKIRMVTSKGNVDIELWSNEAPQACRNIIGLALEGYYDNCPFHRIVPGFIIQTGDPTGTGMGGESFFGEPFADEIHQRLKFTRRGIVALANENEPGTNGSQFFVTLDATPELQNKHTIFGRIEGPTIYNVLALADVELRQDEPDRPVYAPKLLTVEVLDNPFTDIVPRITREERKEQEKAKREAARAKRENRGVTKTKKNTALLSFGEAEEAEATALSKGASKSSHDLLNDKRLKREAAIATPAFDIPTPPASSSKVGKQRTVDENGEGEFEGPSSKKRKTDKNASIEAETDDLAALRAEHASKSAKTGVSSQISELESSLRDMSGARSKAKAAAEEEERKRTKANRGRELLEEARRQYMLSERSAAASRAKEKETGKGKGKARDLGFGAGAGPDEEATLEAMRRFQAGIRAEGNEKEQRAKSLERKSASGGADGLDGEEVSALDREYGASDDDDDDDWRNHRLEAGGVGIESGKTKGAGGDRLDDYEVLDPRQPSAAAARLGFGAADSIAKAKEEQRRVEGRRGRDWVDERDWSRENGGVSGPSGSGSGGGSGGGVGGGSRPPRDGRDSGRRRERDDWYERGEAKRPNHGGQWDGRSGSRRDELGGRDRDRDRNSSQQHHRRR
ncbi:Peptidyl-prolyl isomerase cwc27 [Tilletia horrida]|nr:Peptidyl-prolyl isomerase cwc27 [Tilletia horrida]